MNSLLLAIIVLFLFFLGYRFYGKFISSKIGVDPSKPTPANTKYDGVDFVPAKNWIMLFGHHFASIAGAAPIIGPVIAVAIWGWFPAVIWIVLGSIFFGGVHDFGSLMVSLRHQSSSIANVAKEVISYRAKIIFSIFVLLALILVIAVFVFLCANTFVVDGRIVIPSLGLIGIAVAVGILIYKLKLNQTFVTIVGISLLLGLIILGNFFPISINMPKYGLQIWMIILLIYAFFASITPVHILLQPRDYLASFLLFGGIILGYGGILISHSKINLPAFVCWRASEGWLWPMLLVTIACGAISGFHSLIASGTTSKQLPNEIYAKRIGYGAMLAEGILAALALIAVIAGLSNLDVLKNIITEGGGPIRAFGVGFGNITKPILGKLGGLVAVTILNAFILTTLDTATRIARYLIEELLKIKNRYLSTLFIILCGGWLAWGGKWKKIWPIFGASNQLVAALALIVISCWLLSKNKSFKFTFIPAVIMLATTIGALIFQIFNFIKTADFLLLIISIILLVLALYMLYEVIRLIRKRKR